MIGSYILPVYEYEWLGEPSLSGIADPDAVLVAIVFSVLSLVIATIAFIFKRKLKSVAFLIYFVLVILNVYRIFKMIPVYSG